MELLTAQQLAEQLGVHPATLASWRMKGTGPRYVKIGRPVRYRVADVEAWLEERAQQSPRMVPPDDARCRGLTVNGRCKNRGRFGRWAEHWCPTHGTIIEEGVCGAHLTHGYHPGSPEPMPPSDTSLPDDPAEWLASLGAVED